MLAHLNVHSNYSAMRGLATQQELLTTARDQGCTHLALTEVNGLWGFIRFVQHAQAAGIHPIAGANIIIGETDLILLAANSAGYSTLCRIISAVHDDEKISLPELVDGRHSGLFFLGHRYEDLQVLAATVDHSHLFVELRPGVSESQARRMSRSLSLEIVVTGDVYFLQPEDQPAHKVLRAIEKNATLSQLTVADYKDKTNYFCDEKELARRYPNSLEAINNSQYLAERCKSDWDFVNTIFPGLNLKNQHESNRKLLKLVEKGARQRYGKITKEVRQRIDYEMELITQKGFAPYFLVVRDIVRQTKSTIGRGSAAASVVSYCLFITQVDPILFNLQFERFIHPERESMPDIDVDFPWDERDDILDYVFRKYGNERTAMVASQVFLRPRSAIREVAKVYGLSNEEIKAITKRIGYQWRSRMDLVNWIKTDPRFANAHLDDTLLEVIGVSQQIVGVYRNPSVHPGGVVIVPDEIRKYVPVLVAPKGVQITEWEKDQVEDAGLLKIDLLGNRSLAVVRDTIKQINLYYPNKKKSDYIDYHRIQPVNDSRTKALMEAGKTMGVFYIESPATRQLLAKSRTVDFEHVVIYSSIIRPAANRFTNLMLERIHGQKWQALHQDLDFLDESYGIMVYEEQVSMAARALAGFGYSQADALRKTMSRDSLNRLIPSWKKKFFAGARKRGYEKEIVDKTWDMIASFVGYSFCKPHSASYAMLSFTCAYLKANYTAEFLASVITNQGGFYSAYAYLSEARRFGITILPPNINRSFLEYRGRKKQIRMGLMIIKGLQEKAVEAVLDERKAGDFADLDDFMTRVDLDLSDAMALTNAGCFAGLEPKLTHKEIAYRIANFYLSDGSGRPAAAPVKGNLSETEIRRLEIESFGFPLSCHPLDIYESFLKGRVKKARDIPKYVGKSIRLAGVYITRKVTSTRKHDPMEFLTLEDETDIYECVLFPESYREYGDLLNWEKLFLIRGKVEESFGVYTITIEKLASLPALMRKKDQGTGISLTFDRTNETPMKTASP